MSTSAAPTNASELSKIPLFQARQILTNRHLNELVEYLIGQHQLTRKLAVGTGIISGLGVTIANAASNPVITTNPGSGITSEGFMFQVDAPLTFTHKCRVEDFIPFEDLRGLHTLESSPPFTFAEGDILELLQEDIADDTTVSILEPGDLTDRVYIIFVHRYESATESCFTTSCDEAGGSITYAIHHLLIHKDKVQAWIDNPRDEVKDTPYQLLERLNLEELRTPEVLLEPSDVTSYSDMASVYRSTMEPFVADLEAEIIKIKGIVEPMLGTPGTPAAGFLTNWFTTELNTADSDQYLHQYLYDHLRDLTDAYHEFRERLLDLLSLDFLDIRNHPYHLMVGHFEAASSWSHYRYRHHWRSRTFDTDSRRILDDLQELYLRFALLQAAYVRVSSDYSPPAPSHTAHRKALVSPDEAEEELYIWDPERDGVEDVKLGVRITPSQHLQVALGQRPLPIYYGLQARYPWHGTSLRNLPPAEYPQTGYRYHNHSVALPAWTKNPLDVIHDEAILLRIEGLHGRPLSDVQAEINDLIAAKNLSIDVVDFPLEATAADTIPDPNALPLPLPAGFADLQEHYSSMVAYYHRNMNDVFWVWEQIQSLLQDETLLTQLEDSFSENTVRTDPDTGEIITKDTRDIDPLAAFRAARPIVEEAMNQLLRDADTGQLKRLPSCLNEFNFLEFRETWKASIPRLLEFFLGIRQYDIPASLVNHFFEEQNELEAAIKEAQERDDQEAAFRYQQTLKSLRELVIFPEGATLPLPMASPENLVTVKIGLGLYKQLAMGTQELAKEAGKSLGFLQEWMEDFFPQLANRLLNWLLRGSERLLFSQFQSLYINYLSRLDAWYQANPQNLSQYIALNPGVRHLAGSWVGGTFILAHELRDGIPTVVADFTLPYRCCGTPLPSPICDPERLAAYPIPPMAYPDFSHCVHGHHITLDVKNNDLRTSHTTVTLHTEKAKGYLWLDGNDVVHYLAPGEELEDTVLMPAEIEEAFNRGDKPIFSGFDIIPYELKNTVNNLSDFGNIYVYVWDGIVGKVEAKSDQYCVIKGVDLNLDVVKNDELLDESAITLQVRGKDNLWHDMGEPISIENATIEVVAADPTAGAHEDAEEYKMVHFEWDSGASGSIQASINYRVTQHGRPYSEAWAEVYMLQAVDDVFINLEYPNSETFPILQNDAKGSGTCLYLMAFSTAGIKDDFSPIIANTFDTPSGGKVRLYRDQMVPLEPASLGEPWNDTNLVRYQAPAGVLSTNRDYFFYRIEKDGGYSYARVDVLLPVILSTNDTICVLGNPTPKTADVIQNDQLVDNNAPYLEVQDYDNNWISGAGSSIFFPGYTVRIQSATIPTEGPHTDLWGYQTLAFEWASAPKELTEVAINYRLNQASFAPGEASLRVQRLEAFLASDVVTESGRVQIFPFDADILPTACPVYLSVSAGGSGLFKPALKTSFSTSPGGTIILTDGDENQLPDAALNEPWDTSYKVFYERGENTGSYDYFFYRFDFGPERTAEGFTEAQHNITLPTLSTANETYVLVAELDTPFTMLVAENDDLIDDSDFNIEIQLADGTWTSVTGDDGVVVREGNLHIAAVENPSGNHPNVENYRAILFNWEIEVNNGTGRMYFNYRLNQGDYTSDPTEVEIYRLAARPTTIPIVSADKEIIDPLLGDVWPHYHPYRVEFSAEGGDDFAATNENPFTTQGGGSIAIVDSEGTLLTLSQLNGNWDRGQYFVQYDRTGNTTTSDYFYHRLVDPEGHFNEARIGLALNELLSAQDLEIEVASDSTSGPIDLVTANGLTYDVNNPIAVSLDPLSIGTLGFLNTISASPPTAYNVYEYSPGPDCRLPDTDIVLNYTLSRVNNATEMATATVTLKVRAVMKWIAPDQNLSVRHLHRITDATVCYDPNNPIGVVNIYGEIDATFNENNGFIQSAVAGDGSYHKIYRTTDQNYVAVFFPDPSQGQPPQIEYRVNDANSGTEEQLRVEVFGKGGGSLDDVLMRFTRPWPEFNPDPNVFLEWYRDINDEFVPVPERFNSPMGVAVTYQNETDFAYVAESRWNEEKMDSESRILRFVMHSGDETNLQANLRDANFEGADAAKWESDPAFPGAPQNGPKQFSDMVVGVDLHLYVVGTETSSIWEYDSNGNILAEYDFKTTLDTSQGFTAITRVMDPMAAAPFLYLLHPERGLFTFETNKKELTPRTLNLPAHLGGNFYSFRDLAVGNSSIVLTGWNGTMVWQNPAELPRLDMREVFGISAVIWQNQVTIGTSELNRPVATFRDSINDASQVIYYQTANHATVFSPQRMEVIVKTLDREYHWLLMAEQWVGDTNESPEGRGRVSQFHWFNFGNAGA